MSRAKTLTEWYFAAMNSGKIEFPYIAFTRVVDGKCGRIWIALDKLDYLQHLGVLPRSE